MVDTGLAELTLCSSSCRSWSTESWASPTFVLTCQVGSKGPTRRKIIERRWRRTGCAVTAGPIKTRWNKDASGCAASPSRRDRNSVRRDWRRCPAGDIPIVTTYAIKNLNGGRRQYTLLLVSLVSVTLAIKLTVPFESCLHKVSTSYQPRGCRRRY